MPFNDFEALKNAITEKTSLLAEQLETECRKLRVDGAEKYPLVVTMRGFAEFAVKWLCYEPDMTREMLHKRSRAFTACFYSLLKEKPFKTFMR